MKNLLSLFVLTSILSSCTGLEVPIATAAVGGWAGDEYADSEYSVVVEATAEQAWIAAKQIARSRSQEIDKIEDPLKRIFCTIDKTKMYIRILPFTTPQNDGERVHENFAKISVDAYQFQIRGRSDLAEEMAKAITSRL